MRRRLALMVLLAGSLTAAVAEADVSVNVNLGPPPPPPIVLAAPPPLVVVPGVPVVSYAPAAQVDIFLYEGRWYYPHAGYWYVGPSYRGPWKHVVAQKLPRPILVVPAKYYRVPPGHLKKLEKGHAKGKLKGYE